MEMVVVMTLFLPSYFFSDLPLFSTHLLIFFHLLFSRNNRV